jgi:hypothetical protein
VIFFSKTTATCGRLYLRVFTVFILYDFGESTKKVLPECH